MTTISLFYELKNKQILIWKNKDGNLSFSFNKQKGFPPELKEKIKEHKSHLLAILDLNKIDNEDKAKQLTI